MIIKIPFKTPTINHLYFHRGNIKILTTKARKLRDDIFKLVKPDPLLDGEKLKLAVYVHENWHTMKGDVYRKDLLNREKFLIDSIFKALQLDDKYIFESHFYKVEDDQEYSEVHLEVI